LHRDFFLSDFHVNLCVSFDLISEFHPLILIIWCVDNSPRNCPCKNQTFTFKATSPRPGTVQR